MNFIKGFAGALAVMVAVVACSTVPISGRRQLSLVPESLMISMGRQSYASILKSERVSTDPRLNEIVTRVGQRIAAQANRPDYQWEFKVIQKNEMNAFCLPGGKIAVYTGIIPVVKNEASLAAVLGHEVTHAIANHSGERMSQGILVTGGLIALQATALKNKDPKTQAMVLGALGIGATFGIILPYSRSHETEADEVGQIFMARAGYDPAESIQFWNRFAEATKGSKVPTFMSTHPSTTGREEDMREKLPKAQAEYANAGTKYGVGESF
jgi:predicted Zn-dependent protease